VSPFVIERVYDAPRSRVWTAWTDPEALKKWWGPRGSKAHTCRVDLRPGGLFLYGMTGADGTELWGRFLYREIAAPTKLVFIVSFSDAQAGVTRNPWSPEWPLHMLSTVEFEELAPGRTKVTVTWLPYEASEAERRAFDQGRESLKHGWGGTLDKLADHLKE
jgi:uncharacterized protein YndB with AHSA1/START domain